MVKMYNLQSVAALKTLVPLSLKQVILLHDTLLPGFAIRFFSIFSYQPISLDAVKMNFTF